MLFAQGAFANTSGPNNGATFASVTFSGADNPWPNATNAAASDDSYATATIGSSSEVTYYLQATNFGFDIPSGSTIDGSEVQVERHQTCVDSSPPCTSNVRDNRVRLVKSGTIGSTDRAATGTNWPASDATATYGGPADLWGTTWTVSNINSATTGVVLSATRTSGGDQNALVDNITMTVYYTPPVAANISRAQIKYDDGSGEKIINVSNSKGYAVKITPERTGILLGIDANIREGTGQSIDAYDMNSSHAVLNTQNFTIPSGSAWAWRRIDIADREFDSNFYVGVTKTSSSRTIQLGSDTNGAKSGRSEKSTNNYNQTNYTIDDSNNYMIRAYFNYYPTVSNMEATPNPTKTNPVLTATCTDYEN
ncbi:MAG: hypothetical protein NTW59_05210, partial [Candidatus Diapherotrites archaeon]|nr:hypothetical protein [Candidatus Diapherotrites archaeon]